MLCNKKVRDSSYDLTYVIGPHDRVSEVHVEHHTDGLQDTDNQHLERVHLKIIEHNRVRVS